MILCVNSFRIAYIVNATNHAEQLIRITAPYMSEKELLFRQSQLSQVGTRNDYIKLISDLKSIATTNHLFKPEFNSVGFLKLDDLSL